MAVSAGVVPPGMPLVSRPGERERLFFVRSTGLLDTKASEAFDRITRLAASLLQTPMAAISIVDESRQWF